MSFHGAVLTQQDVDRLSGGTRKTMTSFTIPDSVVEIGKSAFEDCTGLTSVTLPDSVTEIGDEAFDGCSQLTAIVQPGSYAEAYCKKNNIQYTYAS